MAASGKPPNLLLAITQFGANTPTNRASCE